MPNTKITNLTAGNPAQSGDEIPINRGGLDRKITAGSIAALASGQTPWLADEDADGHNLLFDDGTGIKSSETGNPFLLGFESVASAVNYLTVQNSITGTTP